EAEKTHIELARLRERAAGETARHKAEQAGEATRAAEQASEGEIAAAERLLGQARERHAEEARRTDNLRTRLTAAEQAVAEVAAEVADVEMRRTFRQARLSSIAETTADRAAAEQLRARIAQLRAALVDAEATCERLARESALRRDRLA